MKLRKFILTLALASLSIWCKRIENDVIDVSISSPPVIKNVEIVPARINSDTILINGSKSPEDTLEIDLKIETIAFDNDGPDDIRNISFEIFKFGDSKARANGDMIRKNDSLFSVDAKFKMLRHEAGNFNVKVVAVDKSNFRSNEVYVTLEIIRTNKPPVISDLEAPDTVYVQMQTVLIKMTIKATDPDGSDDIKSVQFNTFKPDGSPSSGNPFYMYDDGNASGISGDDKAGDGIYSIVIQLPPDAEKGKYRFEFQAFDRANEPSNLITHFMYVL
jgi:hypothetical protein